MSKAPSSGQTGPLRHEREQMWATPQSLERSWTAVPGTGCGHEAVNHVEGSEKWKELAQWRWRGREALERAFGLEKVGG